jgi:hypothetical protein
MNLNYDIVINILVDYMPIHKISQFRQLNKRIKKDLESTVNKFLAETYEARRTYLCESHSFFYVMKRDLIDKDYDFLSLNSHVWLSDNIELISCNVDELMDRIELFALRIQNPKETPEQIRMLRDMDVISFDKTAEIRTSMWLYPILCNVMRIINRPRLQNIVPFVEYSAILNYLKAIYETIFKTSYCESEILISYCQMIVTDINEGRDENVDKFLIHLYHLIVPSEFKGQIKTVSDILSPPTALFAVSGMFSFNIQLILAIMTGSRLTEDFEIAIRIKTIERTFSSAICNLLTTTPSVCLQLIAPVTEKYCKFGEDTDALKIINIDTFFRHGLTQLMDIYIEKYMSSNLSVDSKLEQIEMLIERFESVRKYHSSRALIDKLNELKKRSVTD